MPTDSQILLSTKTENAMGRAKVEGGLPNVTFFLYICRKKPNIHENTHTIQGIHMVGKHHS